MFFGFIPVYNESPSSERNLLDYVLDHFYQSIIFGYLDGLIIIDDGSTDYSLEKLRLFQKKISSLEDFYLNCITNPSNLGKLHSFLIAITNLQKILQPNDFLFMCDADIFINSETINSFKKVLYGNFDMYTFTTVQDSRVPSHLSGLRIIRFGSLEPWINNQHPDYSLWQDSFIGQRNLELYLEALKRKYRLNSNEIHTNIRTRNPGEGATPITRINYEILNAQKRIYETLAIYVPLPCDNL
ncbi:MAG: glycosyltransferase [Candidatus Woesearchaeota archaeon]